MKIEHLLMCPPTYFDIDYCINPWMDTKNKVNKSLALAQWNALVETLKRLGVKISIIDPIPGLADMTFSGDCGMVHNGKFLASNFRHQQRVGEVPYYKAWLEKNKIKSFNLPKEIHFEGLGDIIYWGNDIIFGYGPRSDKNAIAHVLETYPELNVQGELFIIDDRFFHVALAASYIDKDTLLYYPDAFDEKSNDFIEKNFKRRIAVSDEDALDYFVCNNIPIGKNILLDNCSPALEKDLLKWGYNPIKIDMSEFKKSGGSLRCLVLKI